MNTFLGLGLCLLSIVVMGIFLGLWTYRDASNRCLNAALWTAIVILGPNGIGLLIYFLVARKQNNVKCSHCDSNILSSSKYCINCGTLVSNAKVIEKRPTKHFLIGFIVSFIIAAMCFVWTIFSAISNEDLGSGDFEIKSGMSLFLLETNTKNKWNISYYKSTSKFSRNINKEDNTPSTLFIEAKSKKGNLGLKLEQGSKEDIIDIKDTKGIKEINLSDFNNGKIKLTLINQDCKGVEFKSYWE